MATIDDVARNLGKDPGDVSMYDLMQAGMSGTDAMAAVSREAGKRNTTQPVTYPDGFQAPPKQTTPAAAKLGLDTLGKAILDGTVAPSKGLMDHLEGLLGIAQPEMTDQGPNHMPGGNKQVTTKKPPVYNNTPGTSPLGQAVTPPVAAPALGTGALVAGGIGLLLLLLFMGRR